MNEEKHIIIHFNNGEKMGISFPTQIKTSIAAFMEATKRLLEADKLVIHTEKKLLILSWSSVQYIETTSVPPAALPLGAIKGAKIIEVGDYQLH
jgi:hypothetical protein